ncbi:hypothetical protein BGZ58_011034 [Dissophora ornata]|nr:hypothetical protein BGZ58_011034 [Dissophora ornata]
MRSLVLDGPFELIPLLTTLKGSALLLRHLSLKNTNCLRREVLPTIDLVLRVSPCLEHCTIRTNAQVQLQNPQSGDVDENGTEGGKDEEELEKVVSRHLVLKSLELDIRALTGVQLMSILLQCPDLESFTTTDYGQISQLCDFENNIVFPNPLTQQYAPEQLQVKMTGASPRDHRPNHNKRHMETNQDNKNNSFIRNYIADSNILHLLPTFPHHGGIESVRFGDVALTVLQYCCPRITSLDIGQAYTGKIQSSTLQTFMCATTGLLHLRTRGVTLEVEDMADPVTRALMPWTCTNLETVSVAFGMRTPASLPLQRATDVPPGTPSEAYASDGTDAGENRSVAISNPSHTSTMHTAWAERTVYRQLSLLTHLHVLDIRQSPFMRLQVGAGIELLSSLSMLREFSIAGSEVAAAVPSSASAPGNGARRMVSEAMDRWFEEHWPSVDRIVVASRTCNVKASTMVSDLRVELPAERRWSC